MDNREKMLASLNKELAALDKRERKLEDAALKAKELKWKAQLEAKIPAKVYSGLESAFSKCAKLAMLSG